MTFGNYTQFYGVFKISCLLSLVYLYRSAFRVAQLGTYNIHDFLERYERKRKLEQNVTSVHTLQTLATKCYCIYYGYYSWTAEFVSARKDFLI